MRKRSVPHGERRFSTGVTLLEAVAALAIIGSVLVGLLVARMRAFEAHRRAAESLASVRLAASCAEALRARVIAEGSGEATWPAGYTWSVTHGDAPSDVADRLEAFTVRVASPSEDPECTVAVTVWLPSRPERNAR